MEADEGFRLLGGQERKSFKRKKQLSDEEKCIFEKRVACYEGRTNHTGD